MSCIITVVNLNYNYSKKEVRATTTTKNLILSYHIEYTALLSSCVETFLPITIELC